MNPPPHIRQTIRFCNSSDGTRIAWSTAGEGPVLVAMPNWVHHLELDWEGPIHRQMFQRLASHHRLVRYDARGIGLSDWNVSEFSMEREIADLEAVLLAAGVSRCVLFGGSQSCPSAIGFASRFPERVSKLILTGGFVRGWFTYDDPVEQSVADAIITLMNNGRSMNNPAFRQLWTSLLIPDASAEQNRWMNDLTVRATTDENLARILDLYSHVDVSSQARHITQPALVLHAADDALIEQKYGRDLAAALPNARFVSLQSRNHAILDSEPAWQRMMSEIESFLQE